MSIKNIKMVILKYKGGGIYGYWWTFFDPIGRTFEVLKDIHGLQKGEILECRNIRSGWGLEDYARMFNLERDGCKCMVAMSLAELGKYFWDGFIFFKED